MQPEKFGRLRLIEFQLMKIGRKTEPHDLEVAMEALAAIPDDQMEYCFARAQVNNKNSGPPANAKILDELWKKKDREAFTLPRTHEGRNRPPETTRGETSILASIIGDMLSGRISNLEARILCKEKVGGF